MVWNVKVFSSKFSHDLCCEYIIPWKYVPCRFGQKYRNKCSCTFPFNIYLMRNSKWINASLEAFKKYFDVVVSVMQFWYLHYTKGQKIKNKLQAKKKNLWNQINQFHEKKFVDQIPFVAISKMHWVLDV